MILVHICDVIDVIHLCCAVICGLISQKVLLIQLEVFKIGLKIDPCVWNTNGESPAGSHYPETFAQQYLCLMICKMLEEMRGVDVLDAAVRKRYAPSQVTEHVASGSHIYGRPTV